MSVEDVSGLFDAALQAQDREESDVPAKNPSLEELIDHPSDEVFEAARRLTESAIPGSRKLGIRVLSELGRPRMPYARDAVRVLSQLLEQEKDPELLEWTVSALGNQHDADTLPLLWGLVAHPEPTVRDALCGAITGAAIKSGLDDQSIEILCRLSRDSDSNVRFSATFELSAWRAHGVNDSRIAQALEQASHDKDPKVASAAMSDRDSSSA